MPDQTLKNLIALIVSNDNQEVRQSALRVVSALKPVKERALTQALLAVLDEPDSGLKNLVVEALGATRAEESLPRLVEFVRGGGPDVDTAVRAIGQLGSRGTKALVQVMHQAAPGLRRRIAATLALAGTESAVLATAASLLDTDPGVVEASAKSLAAEVPSLTAGQKRALTEHLVEMIAPSRAGKKSAAKNAERTPVAEAAILRILAALHAPQAEELYWARLDPHQPAGLRSAALQALAALTSPVIEAKLQKLFVCAAANDFQVVVPALMLLKKVPASRKHVKQWLGLFNAPDVAAHALAVEKLREIDTEQVAQALLQQLHHPDKGLQQQALAALHALKAGQRALLEGLLEVATPDETWKLARAVAPLAPKWSEGQRASVFAKASKLHENEDRRADALWFVLRESDRNWLSEQLKTRAVALRKKKNFAASLTYWRLLTRDPATGPQLRFELAATELKLSNHDATALVRESDPALQNVNRLLQDAAFDLMGHVRKATWLEEGDLFYLGFHFAEQPRLAREFGKKVLELVIERWPKTQLGKNAKQKLKSEGLS